MQSGAVGSSIRHSAIPRERAKSQMFLFHFRASVFCTLTQESLIVEIYATNLFSKAEPLFCLALKNNLVLFERFNSPFGKRATLVSRF